MGYGVTYGNHPTPILRLVKGIGRGQAAKGALQLQESHRGGRGYFVSG